MQAPDSWERLKSLPKVMLSVSQLHFQKSHGLYHVIYVFYDYKGIIKNRYDFGVFFLPDLWMEYQRFISIVDISANLENINIAIDIDKAILKNIDI